MKASFTHTRARTHTQNKGTFRLYVHMKQISSDCSDFDDHLYRSAFKVVQHIRF